jgi:hypothetical protein
MPELFKTTAMPIVCMQLCIFFPGKRKQEDFDLIIPQRQVKRLCTADRWTETMVVDLLTDRLK